VASNKYTYPSDAAIKKGVEEFGTREYGAQIGIPMASVRDYCLNHGLPTKKKGGIIYPPDAEIAAGVEEFGVRVYGPQIGINYQTLKEYCSIHGLPTKKTGGSYKHIYPSDAAIKKGIEDLGLGEYSRQRGIDRTTMRNYCVSHGLPVKKVDNTMPLVMVSFEEELAVDHYKHLIIKPETPVCVTADWHMPLCDWAYVKRMLSYCEAHKVEELVIAGDYFNFDKLSRWRWKQDPHFAKTKDTRLLPEVRQGNLAMKMLLNQFKRVYVCAGNHDIRFAEALGFRLPFDYTMRMLLHELSDDERSRLTITSFDQMTMSVPRGRDWLICHTNEYSKMALVVPSRIADAERINVASAHRHHHAIGVSPRGMVVVELGGLFSEKETQYKQQYTSASFPDWCNGFCVIDNVTGVARLPGLDGEAF
jgi:predicted phosphodiesterase